MNPKQVNGTKCESCKRQNPVRQDDDRSSKYTWHHLLSWAVSIRSANKAPLTKLKNESLHDVSFLSEE